MVEERLRKEIEREIGTLQAFLRVYCEKKHGSAKKTLCVECGELLTYGTMRLTKCPYDPKPKCKDCETHCYKPEQCEKVKEVMRFSGLYFVKRGRVDWLWRYFRLGLKSSIVVCSR
ncbi:MAG: nitrous oxide-stimulated promoter family protein [Pseudomonadota bacterium]